MRRDGWKSALAWLGLTLAVGGALASAGRAGARPATPPGHTAATCGARGAHSRSRAPALPYELGDDNVRFIAPAAGPAHGPDSRD